MGLEMEIHPVMQISLPMPPNTVPIRDLLLDSVGVLDNRLSSVSKRAHVLPTRSTGSMRSPS